MPGIVGMFGIGMKGTAGLICPIGKKGMEGRLDTGSHLPVFGTSGSHSGSGWGGSTDGWFSASGK